VAVCVCSCKITACTERKLHPMAHTLPTENLICMSGSNDELKALFYSASYQKLPRLKTQTNSASFFRSICIFAIALSSKVSRDGVTRKLCTKMAAHSEREKEEIHLCGGERAMADNEQAERRLIPLRSALFTSTQTHSQESEGGKSQSL
jgi:hypothetical protein